MNSLRDPHKPRRTFRSGAWDLRRDDRRKVQAPISFSDRRSGERRSFYNDTELRVLPLDEIRRED